MTRIDPNHRVLSDQHLRSNLREITRPFKKVLKRIESGKGFLDIPDTYRLGKGHETFFFNKLDWLEKQFDLLNDEHIRRFNKPSAHYVDKLPMVKESLLEIRKTTNRRLFLFSNWTPSSSEISVWQEYMVNKKIPELKAVPTFAGKPIGKDGYTKLILSL